MKAFFCLIVTILLGASAAFVFAGDSAGGWKKSPESPVLGGTLGVCFDVAMMKDDGVYKMWFSWRPKKSIAYVTSNDGIHWSEPIIVLSPDEESPDQWEKDLNRPGVLKKDGVYHLWFTGQADGRSRLGYATSDDGIHWKRVRREPVLESEEPWEKVAVMCPHVLWDDQAKLFRMWYSAGEQYEPNALGLATSPDGVHWTKDRRNPIFTADPNLTWERHKVTAAQVVPKDGWFYLFYIGFENENLARIGIARSRDGATGWERLDANPIISPTPDAWDSDACYKPFALFDSSENRWRLWYNGRKEAVEQIGLATHDGEDLGFAD